MIYVFILTFFITQVLVNRPKVQSISFKQVLLIGAPILLVLTFLLAFLGAHYLLVICVTIWGTLLTNKSRTLFKTI